MTETEIKSMIDKDLYESILNAFTWEKVREQTNYYYTDKAGILREKRIMVRIRVVGEVAKIQVKLQKNKTALCRFAKKMNLKRKKYLIL